MVRQVSFLTGLAGMGEIRTLFAAEASHAEKKVTPDYTAQIRRMNQDWKIGVKVRIGLKTHILRFMADTFVHS
jgi:hypothetical protein